MMKTDLLKSLKNTKESIDKIIEDIDRDIDYENKVREGLANPSDMEQYIKDLEKLAKKVEELTGQLDETLGVIKSNNSSNSPAQ